MDRRSAALRGAIAAFAAVLAFLVSSGGGEAFNSITVHVTVDSAETFGACWDSFCNKPDLFVVFYGKGGVQQAPTCRSNTVINRVFVGNPPPNDWTCGFVVSRPGKIFIGLYDGDGPNGDNTSGEQVDIAPGDDLAAPVDVESLATAQSGPVTRESRGSDRNNLDGKITYTVRAVLNPGQLDSFFADRGTFRPSAGEQILLTAYATGAPYTLLRIHGYDPAGAEIWNIAGYLDLPGQTKKTFVWQGRDPNGAPLPPGTYKLVLQGFDVTTGLAAIGPLPGSPTPTVGGHRTLTITIAPPPAVPALTLAGIHPSPKWSPEVGDLSIRVASSATATVSGEVFGSVGCTGQKLADLSAITVEPSGTGRLTWNGVVQGGATVAPGTYGIKLSGRSGGTPTAPASLCDKIEVVTAPGAVLYVRHAPFLPRPGQTVEVTARSVDPTGAPRVVGALSVFGSVESVPGTAPATPTTPLRTCTMVSSCTATIALPSGGSFVSWKATAADRAATTIASVGWRGQRVIDPVSFSQSAGLAMPVDVALTGSRMADARSDATSLDLLFSVSTDYTWTSATDRDAIGDALDRFLVRMWGLSGNGSPALTTFSARPELVRLYLTPERHAVSWTPAANLCSWTAPYTSWADAIAVLHKTDCRDNAYPQSRTFSAKLLDSDTIFHELHHALFGLADEYPSGTGGYSEDPPLPNVFNTLAACTAVPGRETGGCGPITERDVVTGMPTGRTFFRLDASTTDVMVNNGTQRFADIRRANWKESECDAGRC